MSWAVSDRSKLEVRRREIEEKSRNWRKIR
jgi:hypothetical protein